MDIKVRYSLHIEPGGTQRATVAGFAKQIVASACSQYTGGNALHR